MKVCGIYQESRKPDAGIYIEFKSFDNVKIDTYFKIIHEEITYHFKVVKIVVSNDFFEDSLLLTAVEGGYRSNWLDNRNVDLRKIIGCEVIPVIDVNEIKTIKH